MNNKNGDNASARDTLMQAIKDMLDILTPWMKEIDLIEWHGSEGFLSIIRRSMIKRQFEFLLVITNLVKSHHGFAAVPLIRPACEELLWIRYLNQISESDASDLLNCLIPRGILKDLEAQCGKVGETLMSQMGLSSHLSLFRSNESDVCDRLKLLGSKLDWPKRSISNGEPPSTWFIAKSTDSKDLYQFLYHGTSRYVHFSVVELARRGWGKPGELHISSDFYEPIWAQFSLAWGSRILGWTILENLEALRREGATDPDHEKLQSIFDKLMDVELLPLITPDELRWPSKK